MTVTVTEEKPNNFPAVEIVDAKDSGRGGAITLGTRIEGHLVRVTVHLSYEQAAALSGQLNSLKKR